MSAFSRVTGVVFFTITLGITASVMESIHLFEESLGLHLLFDLRGLRKPPTDIVIVSLDTQMDNTFDLPKEPRKWPRSLYAELVDAMTAQGVTAICFDLIFKESYPEEDRIFAKSIEQAANVVLYEDIEQNFNIVKLIQPISLLGSSAAAIAPFPLPKEKPKKVAKYWTFREEFQGCPTLPVALFQLFVIRKHDDFFRCLEAAYPFPPGKIRKLEMQYKEQGNIETLINNLRQMFQNLPSQKINTGKLPSNIEKKKTLESLTKLFLDGSTRFINFYGPPGTIHTLSYPEALELASDAESRFFEGKIVFIGLSELHQFNQQDSFHTVYSQPNGIDLCGVEILATAFANLRENISVEPLSVRGYLIISFIWGTLSGLTSSFFRTYVSAVAVLLSSALYLAISFQQFRVGGTWYPLVIPLMIQAPAAFFTAILWKQYEMAGKRRKLKKVLGYYVPKQLVNRLAGDMKNIHAGNQMINGVCMFTDAQHFTRLSEILDPMDLSILMNRYYDKISKPVIRHDGTIARIIGDGMLVIWASVGLNSEQKRLACLAAIGAADAVRRFNSFPDTPEMPTRIGIHSGRIFYGNIGSEDHYDYTPMGDVVNTASRLESLNKQLGTQMLASRDVLEQVSGVLYREIGEFLLVGKSKSIFISELICRREDASDNDRKRCAMFAEALGAFRSQSWETASSLFKEIMSFWPDDGPSAFYLSKCIEYRQSPPGDDWSGLVTLSKK